MGRRRKRSKHHGVLVVDKPRGPTSHDVVARARRAFDTGAVGHAGTLDPMATGVLVLAVGEATKLVPHLTAADKAYEAEVCFGTSTDTLDAEGEETGEAEVGDFGIDEVARAAETFLGTKAQIPPRVSAIKVNGKPMHARVRRGEDVTPAPREVVLESVHVDGYERPRARISLTCGKGFYVRSFARDLAEALGTVGHLSALRRTRSGTFEVCDALPAPILEAAARGDGEALSSVVAALRSPAAAWPLGRVSLTDQGVVDARHGRRIGAGGFIGRLPADDAPVALLDPVGAMVAIGQPVGDGELRVVRGLVEPD